MTPIWQVAAESIYIGALFFSSFVLHAPERCYLLLAAKLLLSAAKLFGGLLGELLQSSP
ncbi:hypothetical protein [Hymenobacter lapidarius]|uniref:hypothetical protein n=1 Tax=Hymenobacter lapidarius TaxID=1908237 RepID=UPI001300D5BA|nr:hypothetical protein [Hymenobacter lapidarius]